MLSGFYPDTWKRAGGAWEEREGGKGEAESRQGVMGKTTLTAGLWRQVAEEESWTATSERSNCG